MRTRRYFTDSFKKEIVYKLETNQLSLESVKVQYGISKSLTKKWTDRYKGISGQLRTLSTPIADPLNTKIDKLLIALIERKLEELVAAPAPMSFHSTDRQAAQI